MRYAVTLTSMMRRQVSELCAKYEDVTVAIDSTGEYMAICDTIDSATEITVAIQYFNQEPESQK